MGHREKRNESEEVKQDNEIPARRAHCVATNKKPYDMHASREVYRRRVGGKCLYAKSKGLRQVPQNSVPGEEKKTLRNGQSIEEAA